MVRAFAFVLFCLVATANTGAQTAGPTTAKSAEPAPAKKGRSQKDTRREECRAACFKKGLADKKYINPKAIDLECRSQCKARPTKI